MASKHYRKEGAAPFLEIDRRRVTLSEAQERFAERDRREASDTRTPAQKWLEDPAPGRSALAIKIDAKHKTSAQ